MSETMRAGRRNFLRLGSLAVASLAISADARAQQPPHLAENDPTAQALGYKNDAAQADKKKFVNWKADQTCANCTQFQGKPADAWAPCAIFPGKQVSAKGWCSAWIKKA